MSAPYAIGYAVQDTAGHLVSFKFSRRNVGDDDVEVEIKFCGICHSDIHQMRNEWGGANYPMVPGHEIAGVVSEVGSSVTRFKVAQHVGVGCMVNSCQSCDACDKNLEQYCTKCIQTYNSTDKDGTNTMGGYSNKIVCNEKFVLRIPDNISLMAAGPLMCAGITTFSPMMHYGLNEAGKTLGVVGLGGLGHLAIAFGKALGLKVVVLSTSARKEKEAKELLKADAFVVTKDEEQLKSTVGTLDYILDTVSAKHDLEQYLSLLKVDGKYVVVGIPPEPYQLKAGTLINGRKLIGGSMIGGIKETQDMLDFCGQHDIAPLIEMVTYDKINEVIERLHKGDVRYRFVLDSSSLPTS